jgi:hypothetical protein
MVPEFAEVVAPRGAVLRRVEEPVPCRHIFAACRRGAERAPAVAALIAAMSRAAGRPVDVSAAAA